MRESDIIINQTSSSLSKIRILNNIILGFISLAVWYFMPVLSVFFLLFILGYNRIVLIKQTEIFIIVLTACSFGLISYVTGSGGDLDTDMIRYRQSFETLSNLGTESSMSNSSNVLFVAINLFLANYISTDSQVMSFVFTSLSYFFLVLSVLQLSRYYLNNRYLIIILFSVIFIISILTTTEYVKQVLASAIFLFALVRKIMGKKWSYFWLICSLLVHLNSTILILPLFFYDSKIVRKYILYILFICLILSQVNIVLILSKISNFPGFTLLGLSQKLQDFAEFNSWGGSKRYYLIFMFYLFQITPILYHFWKKRDLKNPICVLFLLSVAILLFSMSNNHNFARLTRNLYPLHILALIFSIKDINFKFRKIWIYFIFICMSISNIIEFTEALRKNEYYPTFMGNDYVTLFSSNVSDFINYTVL